MNVGCVVQSATHTAAEVFFVCVRERKTMPLLPLYQKKQKTNSSYLICIFKMDKIVFLFMSPFGTHSNICITFQFSSTAVEQLQSAASDIGQLMLSLDHKTNWHCSVNGRVENVPSVTTVMVLFL